MWYKVFILSLVLLLVDAKSSSRSWHSEGSSSKSDTPEDMDTSESSSKSETSERSSSITNKDTESSPSSSSSSNIEEWEICYFLDDPHVNTTDGRPFNIHDVCKYDAAIVKDGKVTIQVETFQRNVIDVRRGVSLVERMFILIQDTTIIMTKDTVTVDGTPVSFPYEGEYVECWKEDYELYCVSKKYPVAVSTDMKYKYYIRFGDKLEKEVKGLCGNFNGKPEDDFRNRDKDDVGEQEFITSWETPGCA